MVALFSFNAPTQNLLTYVKLIKTNGAEAILREKMKRLSGRSRRSEMLLKMSSVD